MNYELRIKNNEERVLPFIWLDGDETEVFYKILLEEGASVHLVGLFLGTGERTISFSTDVIHKSPKTFSRTTIRGVFMDKARINNDGMVRIKKGAVGADGYFNSKILLFDDARGRSVPSLEIDENDLKAGHASTIGRPDSEQLFYMKSRGLSENEAVQLLIKGFFDPILILLPEKERKDALQKLKKYL